MYVIFIEVCEGVKWRYFEVMSNKCNVFRISAGNAYGHKNALLVHVFMCILFLSLELRMLM
jgi:hypothetical protein